MLYRDNESSNPLSTGTASVLCRICRILVLPMDCSVSRAFAVAALVVHICTLGTRRNERLFRKYDCSYLANRVRPSHVACIFLCPCVPRGLALASVFDTLGNYDLLSLQDYSIDNAQFVC